MSYFMLIILTLAIGMIASGWVKSQMNKNNHVRISNGMTGAQAAREMLLYYGITNVEVLPGNHGEDFFDPRTNSIKLSPQSYNAVSITATATACHEVGHACQFAQNYKPLQIRTSLVPAVNLCSNAWFIIFFAGIFLNLAGLKMLAIVMYAAVVIFALVTLPVEFNASRRAITYMESIGLPQSDTGASSKVLSACAFTYVAAALTSLLQLLWLLGQNDN